MSRCHIRWGTGLALKKGLLGKMCQLEVHHIFPKSRLYKSGRKYKRAEVNSLANFCFLTKDTNLAISNRLPEEYFLEVEEHHPGALASQWIPMDKALWKLNNYLDFLEARKQLLSDEANSRLAELLHGDTRWQTGPDAYVEPAPRLVVGGITSEEEENQLTELNEWITGQGLPRGMQSFDFADSETGRQVAVFDLAWPNGIQEELSQPVAVLLNESVETIALASAAGFRCFTAVEDFKAYVETQILAGNPA